MYGVGCYHIRDFRKKRWGNVYWRKNWLKWVHRRSRCLSRLCSQGCVTGCVLCVVWRWYNFFLTENSCSPVPLARQKECSSLYLWISERGRIRFLSAPIHWLWILPITSAHKKFSCYCFNLCRLAFLRMCTTLQFKTSVYKMAGDSWYVLVVKYSN